MLYEVITATLGYGTGVYTRPDDLAITVHDLTLQDSYKDVPVDDKAGLVKGVFDSVASRYDIMNDLMSGGMHRLWKRYTIQHANARPGHVILDLADAARRYEAIFGAAPEPAPRDAPAAHPFAAAGPIRITSYNVCYTKLLRPPFAFRTMMCRIILPWDA